MINETEPTGSYYVFLVLAPRDKFYHIVTRITFRLTSPAVHNKSTSGLRESAVEMAQVRSLYVSIGVTTISGGTF